MKQLVFLLLLVGTAAAQGVKTHEMYDNCKADLRWSNKEFVTTSEMINASYCSGYLRGVADGLTVWLLSKGTHTFSTNVTTEALMRSFVNYVNAHPAEMDAPKHHLSAGRCLGSRQHYRC